MSRILGSSGRPLVELGGDQAHRVVTRGDIVASLQWIDLGADGSGDGPEPVLALFSASRRAETGAFVLPAANAHLYLTSLGQPTPHLYSRAFAAATQMGFHPDRSTVFRVMDLVWDLMPDLLRMPSDPPAAGDDPRLKKPVFGIEATATVNGRVISEGVI